MQLDFTRNFYLVSNKRMHFCWQPVPAYCLFIDCGQQKDVWLCLSYSANCILSSIWDDQNLCVRSHFVSFDVCHSWAFVHRYTTLMVLHYGTSWWLLKCPESMLAHKHFYRQVELGLMNNFASLRHLQWIMARLLYIPISFQSYPGGCSAERSTWSFRQ